jgi:hypothetical protein
VQNSAGVRGHRRQAVRDEGVSFLSLMRPDTVEQIEAHARDLEDIDAGMGTTSRGLYDWAQTLGMDVDVLKAASPRMDALMHDLEDAQLERALSAARSLAAKAARTYDALATEQARRLHGN